MDVNVGGQGGQIPIRSNTNEISDIEKHKIKNMKVIKTQKKQEEIKQQEIKDAIDKLNKLLEDKETYLKYEIYGKLKSVEVQVLSKKTDEVLKEIPPKKILDMIEKFCEMAGILLNEKV